MIIFLLLTGPVTYLMRACGLLLVRTRLMPRQMSSGMALASTAVLAALVAPSLLRPAGHLAANPLNNPRLLVALLVLPLILALRRNVQAVLSGTVLSGMGLLWALSWLAGVALPVSVPLTLLLLAGVSLALLASKPLLRLHPHREDSGAPQHVPAHHATVTVMPIEYLLLPSAAQVPCVRCACLLPEWARYCGQCGLPQPVPTGATPQPHREGSGGLGHAGTRRTSGTVLPIEYLLLPSAAQLSCARCACLLPEWARYCGQCGLPVTQIRSIKARGG